jgi:hypothetical protein
MDTHLNLTEATVLECDDPEVVLETWRDACEDVRDAYRAWAAAPHADAGAAHAAYVASADREAAAARLYEHVVRRAVAPGRPRG